MSTFLEEEQSATPAKENTIWCEKYRPKTLAEYVGNDALKAKVAQYIAEQDIPHLLFYASSGTGKTSLAKLITSAIKCDVMYINASDENSIETVRTKIKGFASSIGFNDLKVVILDEGDYLSPAAQAGLRNLMETFSVSTRFILTGNYQERIIEPILSRLQPFQVIPPNKKDVAALLLRILLAEKVSFDKESIVAIVQAHYPDIRAVINTAQRCVVGGVLTLDRTAAVANDTKSKVVEILTNPDRKSALKNIRQLLADSNIRDFTDFYAFLYEKVDVYAPNHVPLVILELADGQYKDAVVVDKEINFCSCIIRVLNAMK